jgi:hypothetical protein
MFMMGDGEATPTLKIRVFLIAIIFFRPVLITDAMTDWPASTKWDWSYFLERYASHKVAMKAVHGKLKDYQMLSVPLQLFSQHVHEASAHTWTYINDELFIPFRPELMLDVKRPVYIEEDFFKLLPKELQPWDTMLLWGTSFSRSSLHIDPYNWTGTNAVLKGRKKWKLFPPGQDHLLYVRKNQHCGFPLDCFKYNSEVDAFDPDYDMYPLFAKAKYIEFEQLPGELLMIPTGWFHQAYNPEECLAISSQVYNSQNVEMVTEEILKVGEVQRSKIPDDFDTYDPKQKVEALVKAIPSSIRKKGKEVTENIASQFRETQ